jgi:hypothetical protein
VTPAVPARRLDPPQPPQLRRVLGFRDLLLYYVVSGFRLRWVAVAGSGRSALDSAIAALALSRPLVFCVLERPQGIRRGRIPSGEARSGRSPRSSPWLDLLGLELPYLPGLLYTRPRTRCSWAAGVAGVVVEQHLLHRRVDGRLRDRRDEWSG